MPVGHTTLPACSREVGNYHPLADRPASRPEPGPGLAESRLTHSARGAGQTRSAPPSVPPSPANVGLAPLSANPRAALSARNASASRAALRGAVADHLPPAWGDAAFASAALVLLLCGRREWGGGWVATNGRRGCDAACAVGAASRPSAWGERWSLASSAAPCLAMRAKWPPRLAPQILVVASRPWRDVQLREERVGSRGGLSIAQRLLLSFHYPGALATGEGCLWRCSGRSLGSLHPRGQRREGSLLCEIIVCQSWSGAADSLERFSVLG